MQGDPWWAKYALLLVGWLLGLLTKELSERITLWIRGPRLRPSFGQGEDCVTLTPEEFDVPTGSGSVSIRKERRVVFFARLCVTNIKPRIAAKCQAWLVNVERRDEHGQFKPTVFKDSIPLIWSYNAKADTVDIAQRINRYVDLVRIQDDVPGLQPQLRSHSGDVLLPHRFGPLFRENGTYRFTVLVSAQDVQPEQIRVLVTRAEQWPPKAELAT